MKNTVFAIAVMAVMFSFASCTNTASNSEAASVDSTAVVDSKSHAADTTSAAADSTSVKSVKSVK